MKEFGGLVVNVECTLIIEYLLMVWYDLKYKMKKELADEQTRIKEIYIGHISF